MTLEMAKIIIKWVYHIAVSPKLPVEAIITASEMLPTDAKSNAWCLWHLGREETEDHSGVGFLVQNSPRCLRCLIFF